MPFEKPIELLQACLDRYSKVNNVRLNTCTLSKPKTVIDLKPFFYSMHRFFKRFTLKLSMLS